MQRICTSITSTVCPMTVEACSDLSENRNSALGPVAQCADFSADMLFSVVFFFVFDDAVGHALLFCRDVLRRLLTVIGLFVIGIIVGHTNILCL